MIYTQTLRLAVAVTAWLAPAASANVSFFIERFGSTDNGEARFLAAAGTVQAEGFEDPIRFPEGAAVPILPFGGISLALDGVSTGGPFVPVVFFSEEFAFPGRFFGKALVSGTHLVLSAGGGEVPRAIGLWIFDDDNGLDSAYSITVEECDGSIATANLENQIPLNPFGHELEGFVGAVSAVGIASLTITAIDPVTRLPNGDLFEIDELRLAAFPVPRSCVDLIPQPPPEADDPANSDDPEDAVDADDSRDAEESEHTRHPPEAHDSNEEPSRDRSRQSHRAPRSHHRR